MAPIMPWRVAGASRLVHIGKRMNDPIRLFDRQRLARHRDRAAARLGDHTFLFETIGERLADRLDDIRRRFPRALDLGCHDGTLGRLLAGRGGIEWLFQSDLSEQFARLADGPVRPALVADEEALPFAAGTFDLVLSNLSLHWVMDMVFRDDECRVRTDHAPANFTTLKHMAHNLIRKAPGKDSLRLKRKVAAWDDDFLARLITA